MTGYNYFIPNVLKINVGYGKIYRIYVWIERALMTIIGIDPGYAIMGYGIVEYNKTKFKLIDYGAVTRS